MKRCTKCGEVKALSEYHKEARAPDGRRANCKPCQCAYLKGRHAEIRAMALVRMSRYGRSTKYGLANSVGLELRDQPCGICGAEPVPGKGGQAIDHCSETGAVRGSLCMGCNTALGSFQHSPELLARAIWYLKRGADYRTVDREK